MMWAVGKIHDKPQPPPLSGLRGPEIYSDESNVFFRELIGKPVYYEHDETLGVRGKVLDVWSSEYYNGQILATILITDSLLYENLKALNNNSLSIGQLARIDKRTGVRTGRSYPLELSVVKEGAVQNSCIVAYGVGNECCCVSQSGVISVYFNN